MQKPGTIAALKQSMLFNSLNENALGHIAHLTNFISFAPKETIVWQGNPSDSLFLITNGIVAVKKIIGEGKEHILAYLMPGLTFGEVGILENEPRSATVAALSEVEVLEIKRDDFLEILNTYPSVAIELAKTLGRYLVETSKRQSMGDKKARLILLMNVSGKSGGTSICSFLAQELATQTGQSTVFMEYPNPENVLEDFDLQPGTSVFSHPGGFDVLVSQKQAFLPADAAATLMLDSIIREYQNIIISTEGEIDGNVKMMLEYARQILVLAPPSAGAWEKVKDLRGKLKGTIKASNTAIFTLLNQTTDTTETSLQSLSDAAIPFIPNLPPLNPGEGKDLVTPEPVKEVLDAFIDRLERNNKLAIYIPTTVDVDQTIDTTTFVERTSEFLALKFGGSTSQKEAQGVWNSDLLGPVDEKVYIVHTYTTQADLNQHLDEVVKFVKGLKEELRQEAMALEVNQKLTLL